MKYFLLIPLLLTSCGTSGSKEDTNLDRSDTPDIDVVIENALKENAAFIKSQKKELEEAELGLKNSQARKEALDKAVNLLNIQLRAFTAEVAHIKNTLSELGAELE